MKRAFYLFRLFSYTGEINYVASERDRDYILVIKDYGLALRRSEFFVHIHRPFVLEGYTRQIDTAVFICYTCRLCGILILE